MITGIYSWLPAKIQRRLTAHIFLIRHIREPLIYSHMVVAVAWRDEIQGVTRRQWLFFPGHSPQSAAQRDSSPVKPRPTEHILLVTNEAFAAKSGARLFVRIGVKVPAYNLRRTHRDLPDLTSNATHNDYPKVLLLG
jgi:hypothetical protein